MTRQYCLALRRYSQFMNTGPADGISLEYQLASGKDGYARQVPVGKDRETVRGMRLTGPQLTE